MLALAGVLLLTAVRKVGRFTFSIWQVMLGGAVVVLASGAISGPRALEAINWDVMVFLFGMFVVGEALDRSGLLDSWASKALARAKRGSGVLWWVILGSALLSALLMNDTLAIVGTPLVIRVAHRNGWKAAPLLLGLAFGVTVGSVMSPIGNPQNLLIALGGGMTNAFVTFLLHLVLPTIINIGITFALLWLFYGRSVLAGGVKERPIPPEPRTRLARATRIGVGAVCAMVILKIGLVSLGAQWELPLTWIALAGALPILVWAPERFAVLKKMDWTTLVFFASMFVLMQAVWDTGAFQAILGKGDVSSIPTILWGSVGLSQLMSNVPAVALGLPMLADIGAQPVHYMALAAGSTLAGNLFILGAASNVIIIQGAEKLGETVGFWEFSRIGVPLTLLNVLICWGSLAWIG